MEPTIEEEESIRVKKLRQALKVATERAMNAASVEKILKCFPDLPNSSSESLISNGYKQLQELFKSSLQTEFELIIEETNIKSSLKQLDELKQSNQTRNSESREAEVFDPDASVRHVLMPIKLSEKQRYLQALEKINKENARLSESLAISRQKLIDQQELLENKTAQFSEASMICEKYCQERFNQTQF